MWGHGSPGPQPERFIPPAVVTSRHRGWSDRGERPALGHQVDALDARSARTGPQVSCLGPIRPNSSVQLLLKSASTRGTRAAMEGEESVLASRDAPIGSIWTAANRTASPDPRIDGPDSRCYRLVRRHSPQGIVCSFNWTSFHDPNENHPWGIALVTHSQLQPEVEPQPSQR